MKKICLFIVMLLTPLAQASDCEELLTKHLETDLTLSYQEFDQTMGQGFRALANQGCQKEAADLIESYIEANDAQQRSLRWHIAQLRAMHGDSEQAVRYARMSLNDQEDFSKNALRWNAYVLATIAFLEGNRERLLHYRQLVAEGVLEHPGNAMNLRVLDALLKHFSSDYRTALNSTQ